MRRVAGLAIAAVSGVVGVSTLSGCAVVDEFGSHVKEQTYATWGDAPTRGDLAFVPADFVPHDSTDLRIKTQTNDSGKIVTFTTTDSLDPSLCSPASLADTPPIDASWWPDEIPADGWSCDGGYNAFQVDGVSYAWRN